MLARAWCVVVWAALMVAAEEPARALYEGADQTPLRRVRPPSPPPVSPARGPVGLLDATDPLLRALAGVHGRNRLVVCGGCGRSAPCLPRRCPAVLWRRRWALVRIACVAGLSVADIRVMRTSAHEQTCDRFEQDRARLSEWTRGVLSRRVAPLWRTDGFYDTALLGLDRPYKEDEPLVNVTAADQLLTPIKFWMEKVDEYYPEIELQEEMYAPQGATFYTLFVTGILPAILFLLMFLFVTFGTGTPIKVPYSTEKEGIVTPWMLHRYPSDVKCYPTYGQV